MPAGIALSVLRTMLNAECGSEPSETVAPGSVTIDTQLLNNNQQFLASQHAYLLRKARAEIALVAGTQYYALPATIDMDRPDYPAYVKIENSTRYRLEFGIGQREYNAYDSVSGVTGSPVRRWDIVDVNGVRKIEVWPIPSVNQTLLLSGQLAVSTMSADGDLCVIDALLLVVFTAAEKLTRLGAADAEAKVAKFNALLKSLKGGAPSEFEVIDMSGAGRTYSEESRRPVVGITMAG